MLKTQRKIQGMCIILSFLMMFIFTSTSFASSNSFTGISTGKLSMNIEGENITYYYTYSEEKTILKFNSKGNQNTIIYDRNENKMYLNGKRLAFEENFPITCRAAVEAGKSYGTLGTDVRDVSVVAGAIIALVGGPATWAAAVALAGVIVGRGLDNVYYTKITYYDDETINQQRPKMWYEYHFYADSNRTEYIGSI
ncbi:hypothetical protein [Anaerophilus nitritogenes]|uniref:hypothetical protein n=1 Tax=Anaerophilus nitritogenes TaxID=2498136 RepID=UPI00101CE23E|nr:hypothetical protein [Anaerophilus nitritogenes]